MNYLPYYWIRHKAVPLPMCDMALLERQHMETKDAGVGIANEGDTASIRKTNIAWAQRNHWLEGVMFNNMLYANREANWNFQISGAEQVQLAEYSEGNYYGWHTDTFFLNNTGLDRKLTAVVQLNNPSEYEGGQLQIEGSGVDYIPLEQGSIVVFPSYLRHQATEVTKGVRYSAALWATGDVMR